MSKTKTFGEIENLRKVMGTLPSEQPKKRTRVVDLSDSIDVTLEDYSNNPYKAMFVSATSTWGDNDFKPKWPETSLQGKLEVIKAVLTHNTLPQAKEMVMFVFRVKGVQRWLFDYHTQVAKFTSFMSIGCRDNNKSDADIVKKLSQNDVEVFSKLKDLYSKVLKDGTGSWQTARTFLPQSYSHSYHFGQNLLSIISTKGFHASKKFDENSTHDKYLSEIYRYVQYAIGKKFPLLAYYMEIMWLDNVHIFHEIENLTVDKLSEKDINLLKQL